MKEEITIEFKDQTGLRISKCDLTTGKVVVNGIEITSVEDWEKVMKSINDLQSQLKAKEEVINDLKFAIKSNCIKIDNKYQEICCDGDYLLEILSKGENK